MRTCVSKLLQTILCLSIFPAGGCIESDKEHLHNDPIPNVTQKLLEEDKENYLSCENHVVSRSYDGSFLDVTDRNGRLIVQHQRERMTRVTSDGAGINLGKPDCNDTIPIYQNGKSGYLLPTGQLFSNQLFDSTGGIIEDTLIYMEKEKVGLIHKDGTIIVPPQYEHASRYGKDHIKINEQDGVCLLDRFGVRFRIENDPNYSIKFDARVAPREVFINCDNNMRRKSKDGKWGIVDSQDRIVIPFEFDAISCPDENLSVMVPDKHRMTWCNISKPYDSISYKKCERVYYPSYPPSHHYFEKMGDNDFKSSLLWTQAFLEYGEGRRATPPRYLGDGVMGHGTILAHELIDSEDRYPVKLD